MADPAIPEIPAIPTIPGKNDNSGKNDTSDKNNNSDNSDKKTIRTIIPIIRTIRATTRRTIPDRRRTRIRRQLLTRLPRRIRHPPRHRNLPILRQDAASITPSPAQAQAYAAGAAAQYGWTGQNWTDLVKLWTRESSWLWYAENASSGAYGIPQSLPGSKMAAFGANWRDDAAVQIDWGLSYIAQRYGSPSKAWEHSEQVGWY